MNRYYVADNYVLLQGNALDVLRELPSESINMCVTSPPYWGLRDYGTAEWEGGDVECGHKPPFVPRNERRREGLDGGLLSMDAADGGTKAYRELCGKCGAKRIDSQLGLEPTPEAYVCAMVDVFREVRRVLRQDGTVWLNIGDSYAANGARENHNSSSGGLGRPEQTTIMNKTLGMRLPAFMHGLKPKDLVGIPWRVAFALQADGWWLRQDIIWSKPNPMPESVTDRCTKSHEYLFLLSKSERYYYDQDAIRESNADPKRTNFNPGKQVFSGGYEAAHGDVHRGFKNLERYASAGRNKRSVWHIATEPTSEAHFATFPVDLVKPCILAGSASGGTVLDPFVGSGTAILTAKALGRRGIGIDLNPEYLDMAKRRDEAMVMQRRAVRKNR